MISEHLIEELRLLNRVEKLRVIQMLANQSFRMSRSKTHAAKLRCVRCYP